MDLECRDCLSREMLILYKNVLHVWVNFGKGHTGLNKQNFSGKFVNIFLPINYPYVLGTQKNRLIETVLLSTHNICFGREIRKLNFRYTLLTKVLGH